MTAFEAYELTTQGGATDFARLIAACESFGPYCLIAGLAVNCYVEPVYTLDVHIVAIAAGLPELARYLRQEGFKTEVRLSKRKKDELDLIRLAEKYPELKSLYPSELQAQLDRG